MKVIDCKGLECPKPVINTKKALDASNGEALEIIVDNDVAKENVSKFLATKEVSFEINEKNGCFHIITEGINLVEEVKEEISGDVIVFSKNVMGQGDDKLGEALMKSFMFALSEAKLPKAMLFLNGGVKLTTEGSDLIDTIKEFESKGVEILSCGTCLDFYGLKNSLKVGGITNMYTIVEHMQNAGKVINL